MRPTVAAALKRIGVYWNCEHSTHFVVQWDDQGKPHSSWVLSGFGYLQHYRGGPPLLRPAPASAAHASLPSEEDKELSNLGKRVEYVRSSAHVPDGTTIVFPQEGSGITSHRGPPPQDQHLD